MDSEIIDLPEVKSGVGAVYRSRVMRVTERDQAGNMLKCEPVTDWSGPSKNLILPGGYSDTRNFTSSMTAAVAGTGSTPNKVILAGTFSQTGTTVTRVSGAGVFAAGNVNDFIKFASGERAKITAFTNTLTVQVDRAQTVAAAALTVYDTSRTLLDTWVKRSVTIDSTSGANGASTNTDAGTTTAWRTFNFDEEVTARIYSEFGFSTSNTNAGTALLLSRVVPDTPVSVDVGQFLQLRIDLVLTTTNFRASTPIALNITGWPRQYSIQSITPGVAGGTAFDVLLTEAVSSHFATGRPFNIEGAIPTTFAISSISSTSTTFTVTTSSAHGIAPGDSLVIAGASPAGYNGTWTAAAGTTGSTIVVTSGINPGAGSGGTARKATPTPWYDGQWPIASFPTANTIRVTNNTISVAAGAAGTVKNNLNASAIIGGHGWYPSSSGAAINYGNILDTCTSDNVSSGSKGVYFKSEANIATGLAYGVDTAIGTFITGGSSGKRTHTNATSTYDADNRRKKWVHECISSDYLAQDIRQMVFTGVAAKFWVTFEERQRKDNGYKLTVNYYTSWEPALD